MHKPSCARDMHAKLGEGVLLLPVRRAQRTSTCSGLLSESLSTTNRIEDLFELVLDAEMLNPSEVAVLPVVLMQLYKQRSGKEQAAVVTHAFFEGLIKSWALEPSKLPVQEQLATLNCLVEMNRWNPGAGHALTRSTIMVSHAVKNSLQGVPTQFTATQLLQVLGSCNKTVPAHMQTLVTTALGVVPQCSAAALKNLLWALGTVGSADHRLLIALEAQLLSQSPYLGASHVSMAVWAFGRLNHLPHLGLMQELASQAMLNSASLTTKHSKQLLWGWYTLRYYPPDALLEAIAKRLTPLVHNMDAFTLSEFIWAFGGLNYEPGNMQLFLQALANLAWSMAHLNYKHEGLLDAIVNQLLRNVDDMNQRDVADLLSALAMLKHQPITQATDAIVQHMIYLLQEPGTTWVLQDLSTVCWSVAKLNRKLLDLIYHRILVDVPVRSAKDISYQLWGFAVLGYPLQSQVLAAYWDWLQHVLADLDPVDLSHVMWAVACLDSYPASGLLDALLATLPPQISSAEPAAVVIIVHACGALRHHPGDAVLAAIEDHAQQNSSSYLCQLVSTAADFHAFACSPTQAVSTLAPRDPVR
ncbi:hypothetical protein WJX82_007536 [Trebouxia sp. C0006]